MKLQFSDNLARYDVDGYLIQKFFWEGAMTDTPDWDTTEEMYMAGRIAGLREAADKFQTEYMASEATDLWIAEAINEIRAASDKLEAGT